MVFWVSHVKSSFGVKFFCGRKTIELGNVEINEREFSVANHGVLGNLPHLERVKVGDIRSV